MSTPPIAGTFRLDGMLQGPAPDPVTVKDLEAWVAAVRKDGFVFHLGLEGPNFSIVPDPAPQRSSRLSEPDVAPVLAKEIEAFLRLLPFETLPSTFSTLRSEQFHPGEAIQTVYAIGPDGTVRTEQRSVDVETSDPPPELSLASLRRAIVPALIALLLAFFISTFFVDYRKLWSEAKDTVVPLKIEEVDVDSKAVADYVTIELTDVDKGKELTFKFSRGPKWNDAVASTPATTESWSDFANRLAIHQGRLRVEFRNKEDKVLREGELKIAPLRKKETLTASVPGRFDDRLARIVIQP